MMKGWREGNGGNFQVSIRASDTFLHFFLISPDGGVVMQWLSAVSLKVYFHEMTGTLHWYYYN